MIIARVVHVTAGGSPPAAFGPNDSWAGSPGPRFDDQTGAVSPVSNSPSPALRSLTDNPFPSVLRLSSFLFAVLLIVPCTRAEWFAGSPANEVTITLSLRSDGTPYYSVSHRGKPVVLASRLGFESATGPHLLDDFEFIATRESQYAGEWSPIYGERQTIPDRYHERRVELRHHASSQRLDLVLRAYPEGAALRYEFPANPQKDIAAVLALTAERTEFRFLFAA